MAEDVAVVDPAHADASLALSVDPVASRRAQSVDPVVASRRLCLVTTVYPSSRDAAVADLAQRNAVDPANLAQRSVVDPANQSQRDADQFVGHLAVVADHRASK